MNPAIGQLLAVGFEGTSMADDGVRNAIAQAEAGLIGGIILYRYNIENPAQVKELLNHFKNAKTHYPLFIMLDQEGGKVQRVSSAKGFTDTDSAQKIAREKTPEEAYVHYEILGKQLSDLGFNFNFAPCIDVDHEPPCKVIGELERSYSTLPESVSNYALQMIRALRDQRVISCAKHFPGHGSAPGDTHLGLVNITKHWSDNELTPYKILNQQCALDSVMSAHLVHNEIDSDTPVVFSKKWLSILREEIGFNGVIVTDDLHMGAIVHEFSLAEIVINALTAGHDLLLFSNNPLASQQQGIRHDKQKGTAITPQDDVIVPDPAIAEKIFSLINDAVDNGILNEALIAQAIERVVSLKRRFL